LYAYKARRKGYSEICACNVFVRTKKIIQLLRVAAGGLIVDLMMKKGGKTLKTVSSRRFAMKIAQTIAAIMIPVLALLASGSQVFAQVVKVRVAVVGLDHDHVWGLLNDLANDPQADFVGIAETNPELVSKAKAQVPDSVKFYSDYVRMLDEAKPQAVIITTENDKHLEIVRECAKRHIHVSMEKPMATSAADAREMQRLADDAGIKLMVNYWNAWTPSSHALFHRVKSGDIGPVQKIVVQYGHQGPKEIGVSPQFAAWLYDPAKNGGGALMDFGCYGAEWALWLKGRPTRVYATARTLKTDQHNDVEDDATIVLDYPDATVIVEPSWDWPYGMDRVYAFGSKGSLLATRDDLLYRQQSGEKPATLDGDRVALEPAPRETSNPVAYFLNRIRTNQPIADPLTASLNVQVMEILDAARESIRSGRAVELH
jgi:predicted dehydrogenase